jgi:hypothetical protein
MNEKLKMKNEKLRRPAEPASIFNERERSDPPALFIIHFSSFILPKVSR